MTDRDSDAELRECDIVAVTRRGLIAADSVIEPTVVEVLFRANFAGEWLGVVDCGLLSGVAVRAV